MGPRDSLAPAAGVAHRLTRSSCSTKFVFVNVTISLESEVARWARIRAAERNTSMSRYVGEMLREQMAHEDEYERAMNAYLSSTARIEFEDPSVPYPKREELYERSSLH